MRQFGRMSGRDERYQPRRGPPRTLIDKLGVKPGSKVSVIGVSDPAFWRDLRQRTDDLVLDRAAKGSDLVVFGVERPTALKRLAMLERAIKRDGAIWVVTAKRTRLGARGPLLRGLKDVDVIAAAKAVGLVDNKVVSFSETHTALRLVVPLSRR